MILSSPSKRTIVLWAVLVRMIVYSEERGRLLSCRPESRQDRKTLQDWDGSIYAIGDWWEVDTDEHPDLPTEIDEELPDPLDGPVDRERLNETLEDLRKP